LLVSSLREAAFGVATIWHSAPEKKGRLRSIERNAWNFRVKPGRRLARIGAKL
jgi:hypothetical protein